MSTIFSEMEQQQRLGNGTNANLEEQRALQLAFELSMLGLSETLNGVNDISVNVINHHLQQHSAALSSPQMSNGGCNNVNIGQNCQNSSQQNGGLNAFGMMPPSMDDRSKKSQNMTECVPVPSSEHVAEIVGRQGKR